MSLTQLIRRSLSYYWRTNLAVVLGVAIAVAVLAGALLVGDSVRASLRAIVLQRLGQTSFVVSSSSFFREQLANDIQNHPQFVAEGFGEACPLIALEASGTHDPSKRLATGIKVYGVDDRFWQFNKKQGSSPQDRSVFVSPSLANELGAATNDQLLLQIQKPTDIPLESIHSKKEDLGKTLRLTVANILSEDALGEFSLEPQQTGVRAVFVSLDLLQRELEQPEKVNLVLISAADRSLSDGSLNRIVRDQMLLEDLGVNLRIINRDGASVVSLEHESKMISDPLATIVGQVATESSYRSVGIFSYLANSINAGDRSIPYSLVTAIDDQQFRQLTPKSAVETESSTPPIVINDWAAQDLNVRPGDQITLEYYLWHDAGRLETKTTTFQLAGIVPIEGLAADRDLVPEYPGITGSENISDWDPPFPIDLDRIRQKDEDYWEQFRTTPKAFIPLTAGRDIWQSRFGGLTSLRLSSTTTGTANQEEVFRQKLRTSLSPALMGVVILPVRSESLQASQGATDFGEYFLYFSFFIVVSALLLTTLFFKLGIEQRVREIGSLAAMGFDPAKIRLLFSGEGLILSLFGSIIGLGGAIAYGHFMMFGLRTWWIGAVGTNALTLHLTARSMLIGVAGGIVVAFICILLTLRGLRKYSTRSLLAGSISSPIKDRSHSRRVFNSLNMAIAFGLVGLVLLGAAASGLIGQAAGFFGGGTLILTAIISFVASWLNRHNPRLLSADGWWPIARVGFRNASYRPARSILCIALIASAVFIIVAVDSFRHREQSVTLARDSGTGGFVLLADSAVPLIHDPNSVDGKEALNLTDASSTSTLREVTLTRFRVQPGDDASCLNLYQPRNPRIVAPTDEFLRSDRFVFQKSSATSAEERENPWLLLNQNFEDGAIPVIADANSLTYVLHLKVGEDFVMQHGVTPIRLRVVAALSGSLFQSEFLMSEQNFVRLFPNQQGYRFFLIDVPTADRAGEVAAWLENRLVDFGFDVQLTSERLASFHRVENTYLSTFQMLGGLGLVLGTIGLAAVLLRNVLERRRELALMRAVGYNSRHFTVMIVAENVLLLITGVAAGTICAMLAIMPVVVERQGQLANASLGVLLLAVLVSGLLASVAATFAAIRAPLLPALRAE